RAPTSPIFPYTTLFRSQRADQLAAGLLVLEGHNTQAATALRRVLLHRGALAVTTGGGDEQRGVLLHDRHGQQLVLTAEAHAVHTGSGAAHRAQRLVVSGEAHG